VVILVAGKEANNVGQIGQLLGYLKMKTQRVDGSGDIAEQGYGEHSGTCE
jgi:hypothetical protein